MQRRDFFGAAAAAGAVLVAAKPMAGKATSPERAVALPPGYSTTEIIPALTPLGRVIATDGADVEALREVIKPLHTVDVEWHCQAGELTRASITYSASRLSKDPVVLTYHRLFRDAIEFSGIVTGVRFLSNFYELEVTVSYLMPYRGAANA